MIFAVFYLTNILIFLILLVKLPSLDFHFSLTIRLTDVAANQTFVSLLCFVQKQPA